jgi:hypothetical protein
MVLRYIYKINNNSSIPHMYSRMPVRTRARESPRDVLRLCGIPSQPFSSHSPTHRHRYRLAAQWPHVALFQPPSPQSARAAQNAINGLTAPHKRSAKLAPKIGAIGTSGRNFNERRTREQSPKL